MDHIVESVLLWHRIDSHGCVGTVDSTQDNDWFSWYEQRLEVVWSTLVNVSAPLLTQADRGLLFRSRQCLAALFEDFDDSCVLVHGNLTLRSMLKDARSDQLLAMINPGMVLWAPREYEVFRLCESGMQEALLYRYLQKAPLADDFIYRRWLYVIWDAVSRYLHTGQFDRPLFDHAARELPPWLE